MKKLLFLSLITTFMTISINADHLGFGFSIEAGSCFNNVNSRFSSNNNYYCPTPYTHRSFSGPIIVTRQVMHPIYRPIVIETFERPIFVEHTRPVIYSDDYCNIEDLEEAQMARLAKKSAKRHEQKLAVEKEIIRQEIERKSRREKEIQQRIANQKTILEQAEQNIENLEAELNRISN